MLKVRFIHREKGRIGGFSIEGIFETVRALISDRIQTENYFFDKDYSRLRNTLRLRNEPPAINHVTGDVYFLILGINTGKIILTVHDIYHYDVLRKRNIFLSFVYYTFWMLLPFWKADVITVVSETTEKEIGLKFPFFKDKIRVIPNPVKLCFRFSERIVSHKFRILQIGRAKHKNLKNLIAAIKEMDGVHLDIIADLDEETLSYLREKRISFTQFQNLSDDEVYQRYIACDILFFASLYEGFGMPIIEAQTVGRPVITSNFGAMLEVAKDSAVLVSPDSVDEICKAIVELKENVSFYNEVVARGLTNAANYSAERVSEEYLNLYKSINKI